MQSNNALLEDINQPIISQEKAEKRLQAQNNLNLIGKISSDINGIFEAEYENENESTAGLLTAIKTYINTFYKTYRSNKNYSLLQATAIDIISSNAKDRGLAGLSKPTLKNEFKSASIVRLRNNDETDDSNNKISLATIFERLYLTKNEVEHLNAARTYINNFILENQNNSNYDDIKELAIARIREVTVNRKMAGLKESKIKSIFTEIENNLRLMKIDSKPVEVITPGGTLAKIPLDVDPLKCFSINKNGDIEVTTEGTEVIANQLITNLGLASGTKAIETFIIDEGIWAITSSNYLDKIVNQILRAKTNNYLTNKQIQELSKRLMMNSFSLDFGKNNFNTNEFRVTFKNGTYDMKEKKFYKQFFKEDRSTVKVNHNYREDLIEQRPETLDKFLQLMLDDESVELVYEFIGCLFVKRYLPKKFVLLYGGGDNGKSTLMELFNALLGKENASSVDLKGLTDPNLKFQRILLMDKLANLCGEIPPDYVFDTSLLKILTGNDYIVAEKKGIDPIEFTNFANIIFSCNKLPRFKDNTEGLQNRLLIIPMNKNFKANVTNKDINKDNIHIQDIIKNEELIENIIAYSINKFIKCEYGKNMTIPSSVQKALNDYLEEDLLTAFITENYTFTDNDKDRIACKDILKEFKQFQEDEDDGTNTEFSASGIGKAIEERFSSKIQYKASSIVNGIKQRNVITNIQHKSSFKEIISSQSEIDNIFKS